MIPVEPVVHKSGRFIVFAKDQPPYLPLPALVDLQGTVVTEWELTEEELHCLMVGGRVRLWMLYTGVTDDPPRPLTPIRLEVIEPECGMRDS